MTDLPPEKIDQLCALWEPEPEPETPSKWKRENVPLTAEEVAEVDRLALAGTRSRAKQLRVLVLAGLKK